MRFIFDFKKATHSAECRGITQYHHLQHVVSDKHLIDNLVHEDFHCTLHAIGIKGEKEHHYYMKLMEIEWH